MNDQDNIFDILFVEDDDDDFELIQEAFKKIGQGEKLQRAVDIEDTMNIILQNDRTSLRNPLLGLVV